MQNRIHILPESIANKIAAGEVVQRPESVVKELLENSLDAGSGRLFVQVNKGGATLIEVGDDGSGMGEDDAVLAFQRHATSKISTYEDLEAIRTFGFRGEALASIAAVAQVTLTSRRKENDTAVVVKIDGGGTPRISREAREPGTTITVRNLFYNVPARRKFLKSSTTEFRHVYDTVHRVALSHPDLSIEFLSDGKPVFQLKPSTLPERIVAVFGERQMEGLLPVESRSEFLNVHGYIGKPSFGQRSRTGQYLFLNTRPIQNRNISHAVFSAYENLLTKGTFPFFLLFLEIDPALVDVNIHPSKMEAKFEDEAGVYRFVSALVRKALSAGTAIPALSFDRSSGTEGDTARLRFGASQHSWPSAGERQDWGGERGEQVDPRTGEIVRLPALSGEEFARRLLTDTHMGGVDAHAGPAAPEELLPGDRPAEGPVWQLHGKYILAPVREGIVIADQHVVHERVLYERILRRLEGSGKASQQLLFPVTIHVSAPEASLIRDLEEDLSSLGFDLKFFGNTTVVLDGVPSDLKPGQEERILQDTLESFREFRKETATSARDTLAKSLSCRMAVKAGDTLAEDEMRALLGQLAQATMPYVCPHGRPVLLRLSTEELDRRFGRL